MTVAGMRESSLCSHSRRSQKKTPSNRYGLYSHGLYSYGLYSCGLYSYDPHSYGLCSYGLYSYGLCIMACIVMAYVVMAGMRESFVAATHREAEAPTNRRHISYGILVMAY